MANKPKLNAEFFSHYAAQKKTVPVLKAAFGSDGYAFWYQLLEMLCAAEGHVINCSIDGEFEFISAAMGIPVEKTGLILRKLIERGKIDRELWESDRIIWCQNLVNNLECLYSKRQSRPQKPIPTRKSILPRGNSGYRSGNGIDICNGTQSRVEKSRVEKSRENPLVRTPENPEFGRLANLLFNKILNRHPNHKTPDFKQWCKSIRLMVETDKRDIVEIESVIEWCQQDYFWQNNILSTEKLRKQYDHLILKMNSNGKPNKKAENETPEINAIYSICPDYIYRDERNNPRCRLEDTEPENCRLAGDGRCGKWKEELFEKV